MSCSRTLGMALVYGMVYVFLKLHEYGSMILLVD